MTVLLSPVGGVAAQFFDNNGNPLSGGKLFSYAAGTTTPAATYTSSLGTTAHTNPIILDAGGRVPGGEIWLTDGVIYKFVLQTSTSVLIATYDNISGINANDASMVSYTPPFTGSVTTTVEDKLAQTVSVLDFGADPTGVADSTSAINTAISAMSSGILFFPAGTYTISGSGINARLKSNLTLMGEGMGQTIINGAAISSALYVSKSVITLGNNSGQAASLEKVAIRNMTIFGSGTSSIDHIIEFRGINNVVFDSLEIYGGYNEVVYCDGPLPSFDGLTVSNCYFHDCHGLLSYCINTNTIGVTNILIEGNRFDSVSSGGLVLGNNIRVVNNSFVDIHNWGIKVGESNTTTSSSVSSCVIANNTFSRLGNQTGAQYAFPTCYGIFVDPKVSPYANNTTDNGVIVSNNTFKETFDAVSTTCIFVRGGKVSDNYASGVFTSGAAGLTTFINVYFSSDVNSYVGVNTTPVRVYLSNNILEKKPSGTNIKFGLAVYSSNNAYLYCDNNVFDAVTLDAYFYQTTNGFLPHVYLSNDRFNATVNLVNLAGTAIPTDLATGMFGSNDDYFYKPWAVEITGGKDISGLTTPSVLHRQTVYTNNSSPVTITAFTNGTTGQEFTIFFNDANTTVQNNAGFIQLNGSVNFVSVAGATLTLWKPDLLDLRWYEKSRSKP